jgi:hypothetical protein
LISPALWLLHAVQLEEAARAAIALPVEVVLRVAVTAKFEAEVLACWTMGEGHVIVGDVVKEMDVFLVEK